MPTVLVTGANRGLGLEFVRQYANNDWTVIATCRDPASATEIMALAESKKPRIKLEYLDVLEHASINDLALALAGEPIDVLINNAGIIGPVRKNVAQQSFGSMDYSVWARVFATNVLGPFKVSEVFLPHLLLGHQKRLVIISSTVGSNTEMIAPIFSYASSKAAVTKTFTTLAEVLRPEGVSVRVFCPGHVKTDMGGERADLEKEVSIEGMRKQISRMSLENSGGFLRYNGEVVAF